MQLSQIINQNCFNFQASFSKFQNNNSLMNELETSLTDVEDTKNFINGINGLNNYVPTFTSSPKKSQKHVVNGDQSNVSIRQTRLCPL